MQILLDTHLFIWWLKDDHHLSHEARSLIQEAQQVYISSASIWEIAIKLQLNKLKLDFNELIQDFESEGFTELPISIRHTKTLLQLENHHRDPFDRILIAQAMTEPLRMLTCDKMLQKYSELIMVV